MTSIEETLEQRGKRYGRFADNAQVTQGLKLVVADYLRSKGRMLAADQQEALDMIFHKAGRIVCGDPDYPDNWHDIAGYAKRVEDRLNADGEKTLRIELANGSTISSAPGNSEALKSLSQNDDSWKHLHPFRDRIARLRNDSGLRQSIGL
jgi:hypothetical protein